MALDADETSQWTAKQICTSDDAWRSRARQVSVMPTQGARALLLWRARFLRDFGGTRGRVQASSEGLWGPD